ncbi:DNA polymerase zeta [Mortierella polycephala]|uniref:DNA polymerase n=1 Tax=Mortierella polycephala TaxID=41804 RepID=A0A9P6Q4H7_9FUNG|nr:DNA polymerase zeta [Mortierella polycephala]
MITPPDFQTKDRIDPQNINDTFRTNDNDHHDHDQDFRHGNSTEYANNELEPPLSSMRTVRFKIRIADLDFAMVAPGPLDLHACQFLPPHIPVLKVPVIRIYGANEAGQKTCLHIHQVYPYFYVPYEGSLEPSKLQSYIHQLGMSLNHAAAITFNTPQDLRKSQYVAAITPIKGIPFYGYHVGYSYFLKIYLFNPDFESRIVDLMRSGAIMGTQFQPFEAHVPFRLQFFIDFNLYGMGWLELEDALLRNNIPEPRNDDHPKRLTRTNVDETRIWASENDPGRVSRCEIEMDSTADRIMNRDKAPERNDDARRRKANNLPSQEIPKTQIRDSQSIPWLNHDINKQMVAELVREVMSQQILENTPTQGDFDNFEIKEDPLAASFMTAYESVDFICPHVTTDTDESAPAPSQTAHEASFVYNDADSTIIVDESIISQSARAFENADMDTRKEVFGDLAGLEAIGEQDEDDDFQLPDMDEFQDDDFMDEADLWDGDQYGFDDQERVSDSRRDGIMAEDTIPQFDGGGDSPLDSSSRSKAADEEWKKTARMLRKKRDRSSSSSSLVSNDKNKRFCDIVATMAGPNPESLAIADSQPPRLKPAPSGTSANDRSGKLVSRTKWAGSGRKPSQLPAPLLMSTVNGDPIPLKEAGTSQGKYILECVEIPARSKRSSSSTRIGIPAKGSSVPRVADTTPKLVKLVSDDPIKDDSGEWDADMEDADLEDTFMEDHAQSSDISSHQSIQADPNPRPTDSVAQLKVDFGYPKSISPDREYFLSAMDEMWSSPSPPMLRPSFLYSPPRPVSPDLIPAQLISPATLQIPLKQTSQRSLISVSSSESHSLESARASVQDHRKHVLGDGYEIQGDSLDHSNIEDSSQYIQDTYSQLVAGQDSISRIVLSEDSMTQDQESNYAETTLPPTPRCFPAVPPERHDVACYQFAVPPPKTLDLLSSFSELGLPDFVHQKPYFSKEADVPSRVKVFGGKEFRLQSNRIKTMRVFKGGFDLNMMPTHGNGYQFWEPAQKPPTRVEIQKWLKEEQEERVKASLKSSAEASTQLRREKISQIEGPTPKNPFGCKGSPTKVAGSIAIEKDFLDVLSLEVHCKTRPGLLPDPKFDPILAVFYCWQTDRDGLVSNGWVPGFRVGMITHAEAGVVEKLGFGRKGYDIHVAEDENAMMNTVIEYVLELDPDILAGFEVHNLSWGYLVDRYQVLFSLDMSKLLSRIRPSKAPVLSKSAIEARDTYNTKHHAGLKFAGRHLFNVWRLIRKEVALTNYGFCNVVFHVLQQRVPHYSYDTITKWWTDGLAFHQARVVRYYLHRVQYTLQLVESLELVSRTSEFARVFGVDFFSVISRGSQYMVESMMVRLAKPENFIMISPSRDQVGSQRAAEVIPMVMEPESGFYEDPVVVLDFQSLYPSVMIAYNYCYSTCLGKLGGGTKLGVTEYKIPDGILPLMQGHLQVAPNGVMYVAQEIRRGLLGRMLSEILDTRVMIKKAMKEYPDNKSLLKLLDARQLSLKFIANVTYGYTAASFSGRMPGIEIADSIVLSARETLERSIKFVNENPKWNARVVYGDTDSMFVHLKGRTRQEAFEIGYDIAETITRMNPRPVKLKFEKVYHPCFLVTKKRYVGSSYETPSQKEPIFDAKGIETIRRDGVPAVSKIMETCIKTMFRTQDLSQVKAYFVRQLSRILEGRVPVPDLMFGKEVRMGRYSEKGVPPPGAIVSARRMELDPRAEPQYGERVPYVVVYGNPGARLTDQVIEPKELLKNKNLRLNGEYYIRKHIIPSLERIFQLAGADVKSWYEEMPRVQRANPVGPTRSSDAVAGTTSTSASVASDTAATVIPTEATADVVAAQQHLELQEKDHGASDAAHDLAVAVAPTEALSEPPKFKPKRKGGRGFVSIGARIDRSLLGLHKRAGTGQVDADDANTALESREVVSSHG